MWCSFQGLCSFPLIYISVLPPTVLFVCFFAQACLGYVGSFLFPQEVKVFFSSSVKMVSCSLMGIALNLQITLGSMAIFMVLILPNHEHGMFFYLFVSSLISLTSGLQFSMKRSFTSLVCCIPRYFIPFVAIVNGSSLMIWLSVCYWCIGMLVIFAH